MKIKAIFFDLDGTLLPMDQESFVNAYLGGLIKILAPRGYAPEEVGAALWKSTGAMIRNDGKIYNQEVFWNAFSAILGDGIRDEEYLLDEYYAGDFQNVSRVCGYTERARELIDLIKSTNLRIILATSPLFPTVATESRIRWAGLEPNDFEYVTTYENSRYCKPNPTYYTDLCEKMGLDPTEVAMIGNDVGDDMVAETIGMRVFLLTDCLINRAGADISRYRQGGLDELFDFIKEIINE